MPPQTLDPHAAKSDELDDVNTIEPALSICANQRRLAAGSALDLLVCNALPAIWRGLGKVDLKRGATTVVAPPTPQAGGY